MDKETKELIDDAQALETKVDALAEAYASQKTQLDNLQQLINSDADKAEIVAAAQAAIDEGVKVDALLNPAPAPA